jgi:UDP-N-acetylglucosamine 2-epimerase (non-hydrolysing)
MSPFGLFDYIKLQMEAVCVLSDSGTITEEAALLNLPAVMLRNTHERPEGMDEGALIMAGLQQDRVLDAVRVVINQHDGKRRVFRPVQDYHGGQVSKKIVRIVLSYVDYVNRTVWRRDERYNASDT